MNLEMEGGTDELAAPVEAAPPRELERQPYDETDVAVIRALQGPMEVNDRPYDAAAAEAGMSTDDLLAHLAGMVDRKLLRRVAAILFHRRAGFSANGMGVWRVPEERILDVGGQMAAVRGVSHCYQRPTYEDWPYSVFTMAHGRSKEECDAILDGIAETHDSARCRSRRPLLLDRVQEDPPPLLHRRLRPLGGGALISRSEELYERALEVIPGGVNSPVRAMKQIGRSPDLHRARRGPLHLGRRRQPLRRLGLVVGPADPRPCRSAGRRGHPAGRRPGDELRRADRRGGRSGDRGHEALLRASRWSA